MFRFFIKDTTLFSGNNFLANEGKRGLQYFIREIKDHEQKIFQVTTDTNQVKDLQRVEKELKQKDFYTKLYHENGQNFMLLSREKDAQVIQDVCERSAAIPENIENNLNGKKP